MFSIQLAAGEEYIQDFKTYANVGAGSAAPLHAGPSENRGFPQGSWLPGSPGEDSRLLWWNLLRGSPGCSSQSLTDL